MATPSASIKSKLAAMAARVQNNEEHAIVEDYDEDFPPMMVTAYDNRIMIELTELMKNLGHKRVDYECVDNDFFNSCYNLSLEFSDSKIMVDHDRASKTSKIDVVINGVETRINVDQHGTASYDKTSEINNMDDIVDIVKRISGTNNDSECVSFDQDFEFAL
jgi:hypothetical protein